MRLTLLASTSAALIGVGAAVASAQGTPPSGGGGLGTTTPTTTTSTVTAPPPPTPAGSTPLNGRAMWIWELAQSNGGNVDAVASTARQYGVSTVIVKSSDGTTWW